MVWIYMQFLKKEFQKKISSLAESNIQLYPRGFSKASPPEGVRMKNRQRSPVQTQVQKHSL